MSEYSGNYLDKMDDLDWVKPQAVELHNTTSTLVVKSHDDRGACSLIVNMAKQNFDYTKKTSPYLYIT